MKHKSLLYLIFGLLITACGPELPEDVAVAYKDLPQALDFNVHVKPILSDKCFLCHGPDKANQQADLRLDMPDAAYAELVNSPGKKGITPGKPNKSEVYHRIISHDPEYLMPTPKSNLKLSAYEKAVLVKWIEDGAEYKPHWAFIPPKEPKVPSVKVADWTQNPIDNFVARKLETKKLEPSAAAGKEILLRRLTFDLTGLPPTVEEINNFIADESDNAYEKQVDRLLASPHYGEKMALDWMDLARFADTHGYSVDRYRDMSPWRDWVIKAFNKNLPYDEFVTWQLAGDMLPNPTKEQVLATAFNRIHPQNMEGGIIPEEFRVEYVVDRANTVGLAFMALTVGCAKCHDHKYDPISQKNFYELTSFFNNVNEAGQISWDDAMPVPTMLWTTEKQDELLALLDNEVDKKETDLSSVVKSERTSFENWLDNKGHSGIRSASYPKGIEGHFTFDRSSLANKINPGQKGEMKRQGSNDEKPEFTEGSNGMGLKLNGDAWFDCGSVGRFRRSEPFSAGIKVSIPKDIKNGVIFHKGIGAALYNFRGFHLAIKDNKLELLMAHTQPDNAIIEYGQDLPRDKWIHLVVTYDGSSEAKGFKVYLDGEELKTTVAVDNLYKDITFYGKGNKGEPGLQVGGQVAGIGIGGAVVDDIMAFDRELTAIEVAGLYDQKQLEEVATKSKNELSRTERELLFTYFLHNHSKLYSDALKKIEQARTAQADSVEGMQELMVMKEMKERRRAFVLERGLYDAYGEEVFPNTPESVMPMPEGLPRNRLGFAKWLLHDDHPLTARVTVNRYWQNYFGRGIVRTTEDFGNQGELPSHPELLDWLATEFIKSGWDVKALQKLIVMSATYRQDSYTSDQLREIDSENILLARGPSARLTGEMIRDNALMASGLLNDSIGGKSVKPYQPVGLWKVNGQQYKRDSAEKLYRRSLYTIWKRSVPHPTLATFDTPERSECTVRRQKTNTPLQALVLLNDPTFIETSKAIGEYMTRLDDPEEGISQAFLKLTGRKPKSEELDILKELQKREYAKLVEKEEKAMGWLAAGEYQHDSSLDPKMIAANAVVASTIMNADATITKR